MEVSKFAGSILVVDDNPLITNVLNSLFSSEEYAVFVSNNGTEAQTVLANNEVDVIICDVMMPKMDGYELHHWVRERSDLSHIPFVFLTALDGVSEKRQGREAGADEYITKPFDPRDLLSLIKGKVLRSQQSKVHNRSQFGDYRKNVIHTLSHEFRTPLVAITTGSELLLDFKDDLDDKKVRNLLEAIRRGGIRLEQLVTDFMTLQQIEGGIADKLFETRARDYLVSDLVNHFLDSKQEFLDRMNCKLNVLNLGEGLYVYIYEPQIYDILGRLVDNAVKFGGDSDEIDIDVHCEAREVHIGILDHGIGLDPKVVQDLTEAFVQIDRDKLEQQGSGMGLAIAYRYAQVNKGRLEFNARSEGGAKVELILPQYSIPSKK